MNWLDNLFGKKAAPVAPAERAVSSMTEVRDIKGRLVCHAWKHDAWSISYLLWEYPAGSA